MLPRSELQGINYRTVSSAASTAPSLVPSNTFQMAAAIGNSAVWQTQCGCPTCTTAVRPRQHPPHEP